MNKKKETEAKPKQVKAIVKKDAPCDKVKYGDIFITKKEPVLVSSDIQKVERIKKFLAFS